MSNIYIALPAMDEAETLPLLISDLFRQSLSDFQLFVCVNQPEDYWDQPDKMHICESNIRTLNYLKQLNDNRLVILDRSSHGQGWPNDAYGIGIARRFIMQHIVNRALPGDIIVSMDADTRYPTNYLESVMQNFERHPEAYALSVPYYHRLTGDGPLDRAMLRYEIYMRSYAINMWRIGSPYCFTALGSAIALPVWAYRKIGGMTPKMSGEDFYFLQKLVKTGPVMHWNEAMAYPATRYSDRVFFGTGPALIKGAAGNWESYPVYHPSLFGLVQQTTELFSQLYVKDVETPLDDFLLSKAPELPWEKLRRNFKTEAHFVKACHEKIDGLRILQFLKSSQQPGEDESRQSLQELFRLLPENEKPSGECLQPDFSLSEADVTTLNSIRDRLFDHEMQFRRNHWENFPRSN